MSSTSYETLANLKLTLKMTVTDYDTQLQTMLDLCTAQIDRYCHRSFNVTSSQARTFYAPAQPSLYIDDCATITSVVQDGTTLTSSTNYVTIAALGSSRDDPLYRDSTMELLRIVGSGTPSVPRPWIARGVYSKVVITGDWGYDKTTIPPAVVQACREFCVRLWEKDIAKYQNQLGVSAAGFQATRQPIQALDAECKALLKSYRRLPPFYATPAWRES